MHFYWFWEIRKIVLYDTLLKQLNHEEIVAVVAHEIGITGWGIF